ncbi:amidohydrolase family protein [Actinoallomurus sp. CA-142502]|uniref:6-methylsalicylate decarboxylase n=1 Tax=Actinoallomurus iriomotensis TaxID=478107 RepID=A0A9W6RNC9_9ACTN|nr:amidohydrolase [Actinoallomurus iriomotensis]
MSAHSSVIDFHAHFVPDFYRDAAVKAGYGNPDGMAGFPHWSVDEALAMMDRCGVAVAVASVSSPGVHFGDDAAARHLARSVNEFSATVRDEHPDRFAFLASLPLPDVEGALAEIDHAYDVLHADGVTLKTNARGLYLGDPAMEPVLDALDQRRALVVLHPTSPPGWEAVSRGWGRPMIEFPFDTTRAVADLLLRGGLIRHPGIRMVVPHGGGALAAFADRIDEFTRIFAVADGPDVAGQLRNLYYDLAGFPVPRQLPSLLAMTDPSHLLYGTDWPWTPEPVIAAATSGIQASPLLDQDQVTAMMTTNGLPLLDRFGADESASSDPAA